MRVQVFNVPAWEECFIIPWSNPLILQVSKLRPVERRDLPQISKLVIELEPEPRPLDSQPPRQSYILCLSCHFHTLLYCLLLLHDNFLCMSSGPLVILWALLDLRSHTSWQRTPLTNRNETDLLWLEYFQGYKAFLLFTLF